MPTTRTRLLPFRGRDELDRFRVGTGPPVTLYLSDVARFKILDSLLPCPFCNKVLDLDLCILLLKPSLSQSETGLAGPNVELAIFER
jgi:hypothetical protein